MKENKKEKKMKYEWKVFFFCSKRARSLLTSRCYGNYCHVIFIQKKSKQMESKTTMAKKSPLEKKSSENSPVSSSKVKDRKCVQPAVLAIRTAALLERPPTPTPGASPSSHGCRTEPFLAPIYIPNKLLGNQKGSKQLTMNLHQPQRHSTTRIREINPIAKAEIRDTYRNSKVDMTANLPAVDHISLPKLSNDDIKVPKRGSFLPKIEQTTQQTLTGFKHGSFHAITQHEHQLYGFKRSPLGRLEGNSITSEVRLPAAKTKHQRKHAHKKIHKSDSRQTESSSLSPGSPGQDVENEYTPKPPSLPKTKHEDKKHPRRRQKNKKVDAENNSSNVAGES